MRVLMLVLALWPASLWAAADTATDFVNRMRTAGLDPEQCYRVRELNFSKDDIRIYLTDGYLIFGNPINGRLFSAVFASEQVNGDAEVLVLPPSQSERMSLAKHTESPNLSEHFRAAVMLFTDDTAEELSEMVREQVNNDPILEMGVLLSRQWGTTVGNLAASLSNRMLFDLLTERPLADGFFYATVTGRTLGNFDLVFDPMSREQILVGQVGSRDGDPVFNIWTRFESRSFRNGLRKTYDVFNPLSNYRIEATLSKNLNLDVVTRATMTVEGADQQLFYFEVAPQMEVSQVLLDGQPCGIWTPKALRDELLQGRDNGVFFVFPPEPVREGRTYEIEFHHSGNVVRNAGNDVYYVGSRGSWYPAQGRHFADFDITFRYPRGLDLVFTGEMLEDRSEGDWRITRRRTESPISLAGFNVGRYAWERVERDGFAVEVYANKNVEDALDPGLTYLPMPPVARDPRGGISPGTLVLLPSPQTRPDPAGRLDILAGEVADALEFMTEHFGPPPNRTLTVSPIPGFFGQGFSGLVYLSTVSYLYPEERPEEVQDTISEFFYSEILQAHEVAHQWWGNIVSNESYQDEWLMEGLANYSALLLLEQNRGEQALATALSHYRSNMLSRGSDGETLESAGPISWGNRLATSGDRAWQTITYEKGSWIFHMLRRRMGDERFLSMLDELTSQYRFRTITTEQFREFAAGFLPEDAPDPTLENFFDQWVYGTGIPDLRLSRSITGSAPNVRVSGSVRQTGVSNEFGVDVPIEIQQTSGESITLWVRTGPDDASFDVTLLDRPRAVVLNPGLSTLTTRN